VWVFAANGAQNTGWIENGTWNVFGATGPQPVRLIPSTADTQVGDFQATFHHYGGAAKHYLAYVLFLPTNSRIHYSAAESCLVEYNRISNRVRLVNAAGTDWLPADGAPLGPGGTILDNTWCSIDTTRMSVAPEHEVLRMKGNIRLSSTVGSPYRYATFLQAQDVDGRWSGMDQFGLWVIPQRAERLGVGIAGVGPVSVSSSGGLIHISASETAAGFAGNGITELHVLLASGPTHHVKCQIVYFPQSNTVNLVDDTNNGLVARVAPVLGSGIPISNSVCTVDPSKSTGIVHSNFAGASLWVSSTGALGSVGIFGLAFDVRDYTTHWVQGGTYF
jgi:hypothetical protein